MAELKRRRRRIAPPGDFEDPLSNYDPQEFEDGMERAICDAMLTDMQTTPFHVYKSDMTIGAALEAMATTNFFILMFTDDDGKLEGIVTERDILRHVALDFDNMKDKPVSQIMVREPGVVYDTESPATAINRMAIGGFRHLPVVHVDDRVVGLIGPHRTVQYLYDHMDDV